MQLLGAHTPGDRDIAIAFPELWVRTHVRCGNLQRGRWASEPVSKREVVSSLEGTLASAMTQQRLRFCRGSFRKFCSECRRGCFAMVSLPGSFPQCNGSCYVNTCSLASGSWPGEFGCCKLVWLELRRAVSCHRPVNQSPQSSVATRY